ncbi:Retrovirus-related Pol polyprotein from transposon TNT 1-94 [Sesamum angolense]|uniref:Retrovirus-related Pol polyprotein from transposon TNT 1-94 n=1 Tax=Sesamum angolense TaxID=2727404 RepID=A0AAE1VUL1_9LAMI|nr:Retrovirus-related Pol polyprotein from transposon TNT 1-94 [Sesamum angolense]
MRKLVDSKSLEVDDLDNLPTCESCLKGKMTKKPFVGQSALSSSLLDLIHKYVYGPLNTPTRGGYSYFITFTDDHSRYGYVYLMRYKSEAFGRFVGYPKETTGYYFYDPSEQKVFVSKNALFLKSVFLRIAEVMRSTRESRLPDRYGFLGLTSQLDNDLRIYGEAIGELILESYSDASFQSNDDDAKSQLDFVFKLNGGVVAWKNSKQATTADSTIEAEYIAASKPAKELVSLAKELRSYHRSKHTLRRYYLHRETVSRGDVRMDRVSSAENKANLFTKLMSQIAHTQHLDKMGLRSMGDWI